MQSTYSIKPEDRIYIEEFRRAPIGHHSPGLQRILTLFRSEPLPGKPMLRCVEPYRKWVLVEASGERGVPFGVSSGQVFTDRREAEWEVFKLRWKRHTGEEIEDDAEDARHQPVGELSSVEICGYADRLYGRPGDDIHFMVNCERTGTYRADIVRLTCGDENPRGPGFKEAVIDTHVNGEYPARRQEIRAGSYAVCSGPALDTMESFSVQAFIWPTTPQKGEVQGLISRRLGKNGAGFALVIDEQGALALMIGDGRGNVTSVSTEEPLLRREWYFVGASIDGRTGQVEVVQRPLGKHLPHCDAATATRRIEMPMGAATGAPLVMAGLQDSPPGERLTVSNVYNGKLDSPRLVGVALGGREMEDLQFAPHPEKDPRIVAAWDFSQGISTIEIVDLSANRLHGTLVNLPTRAMTGWNWTGDIIDWTIDPRQWGAIHFHDDDLYDAGWEVDFSLRIPQGLRSGVYAARLRSQKGEDYVPFIVGPERGAEKRIAVLWSTATFLAYGNEHIATDYDDTELGCGKLTALYPQDIFLHERREYGNSLYDTHSDGSGVCYSSRLRPLLNMRPKYEANYGAFGGSQVWGFNADLHLIDWLEAMGHDYDVITDEELHERGLDLLKPYATVITGSHPEYHSLEMLDGLKAYTSQGGRLMYLGGNGFYWRIVFHAQLPGVIEVRRCESSVRAWATEPGEAYQSFDGAYGGTWRGQGRPPNRLVGVGFATQGGDLSTYYRRCPDSFDPRAAFIFEGIRADELIGDFGLVGGGAAGLELDRVADEHGTPSHALRLATSENHTDTYFVTFEETLQPGPGRGGQEHPLVRGDMAFMETGNGGAVFSASSIAWLGSLSHNCYKNNVSRITNNVLLQFSRAADATLARPALRK